MDNASLFQCLLRFGDNTLVLGHRISEWCGKAPALEEDIALANTALDLIGQTQMWLGYAAEVEGADRSADDLAMLRDVWDFRNILMVERPNIDFGHTIMRQFLFDAYHHAQLTALSRSSDPRIAEIAAKSVKEATYHLDRSAETVIALGDGTDVSHAKMQNALDLLWPYAGEMFESDDVDAQMAASGIAPDPATLRDAWDLRVRDTLSLATLNIPEDNFAHKGGRTGARHTEHLGHMLTQMQWLQRAYPGAVW
ncbi:ring-1,2-phenylacetyl-CoA epoxidase subunit PaaC [Sulfitobacter undariae]|uniref:Ring-1,2-phenylacetyl-CoA epoxidase subunit PaaC n=1 Tax=Sulfitobacter undariae TaxID=1563671 RepID=A0A7W6E6C4_9RHOB|nr:1,2-phenylacetyl-CoA epoxidase subunit PaaC [Sulfitobacter undariae]MBB3995571.1 ring-1,2-phenylacetyl-CoA epoxidase subunit PaaC [Sulfitobacter undariae]